MKLTALILMTLLLTGCIDNPFSETKEEKALSTLENELTEYTASLATNKDVKSYLQTKYPDIYLDDSVKILSFGSEPYNYNVYIILKDNIEIRLTTPCIGLGCAVDKDDVILYTENKEKIKDAIKMYIEQPKEEAINSSGKAWGNGMHGEERRIYAASGDIKHTDDIFQQTFVKAKIDRIIRIPIEGRESRIDIKKINVLFSNGCKTVVKIKAEFLNLLDHRFVPDNIVVECNERTYGFILLDLDGAIGLNTHFDKKSSSFVRELKIIEGVISEEIHLGRKQIKEKNTSPENFEFPTMDKDTQKSLEKTIGYLEKK